MKLLKTSIITVAFIANNCLSADVPQVCESLNSLLQAGENGEKAPKALKKASSCLTDDKKALPQEGAQPKPRSIKTYKKCVKKSKLKEKSILSQIHNCYDLVSWNWKKWQANLENFEENVSEAAPNCYKNLKKSQGQAKKFSKCVKNGENLVAKKYKKCVDGADIEVASLVGSCANDLSSYFELEGFDFLGNLLDKIWTPEVEDLVEDIESFVEDIFDQVEDVIDDTIIGNFVNVDDLLGEIPEVNVTYLFDRVVDNDKLHNLAIILESGANVQTCISEISSSFSLASIANLGTVVSTLQEANLFECVHGIDDNDDSNGLTYNNIFDCLEGKIEVVGSDSDVGKFLKCYTKDLVSSLSEEAMKEVGDVSDDVENVLNEFLEGW